MNQPAEPKWKVEVTDVHFLGAQQYRVTAKVSSALKRFHDVVCHFMPVQGFLVVNLCIDSENENPLSVLLWGPEHWRVTVGSYTIRNDKDGTLNINNSIQGVECTIANEGERAMAERCFRNAVKFFKAIMPGLQEALPSTPLSDLIGRYKDIIG